MDYAALRRVADSLIDEFSNHQEAVLLKGTKIKDPMTGKITMEYREVSVDTRAVMTRYSEEAIAKSEGLIKAGDVKFVARFTEAPTEVDDRVRYAGVSYNIILSRPIDPTGDYAVAYVIQGRKA